MPGIGTQFVQSVANGKLADLKAITETALSERMLNVVDLRKVEVARHYFGGSEKPVVVSEEIAKPVTEDVYEDEGLDESTKKHFQMVADLIKGHNDPNKRTELAKHHAEIFSKQNPRFSHDKFYKAANASMHPPRMAAEELAEQLTEDIQEATPTDAQHKMDVKAAITALASEGHKVHAARRIGQGKNSKTHIAYTHKERGGGYVHSVLTPGK